MLNPILAMLKKRAKRAKPHNPSGSDPQSPYDGPMFWATAMGVAVVAISTLVSTYQAILSRKALVATIGQLNAANGQLQVMREQVRDTRKAAAEQAADALTANARQARLIAANETLAKASGIQADASKGQLGLQRDAVVTANRAWIAPDVVSARKISDGHYEITMSATNTGHTPAFDVTQSFDAFVLGPQGNVVDAAFAECAKVVSPGGNDIIYPSTTGVGRRYSVRLTNQLGLPVFVLGCFAYKSLGVQHHSMFCEFSDLNDDADKPKPLEQAVFRYCSVGNRAD